VANRRGELAAMTLHGGSRPAWGKFSPSDGTALFHRLEHHCADVAACFEALVADPVLAARFTRATGSDQRMLDRVTLGRLAVIAFLHDFGKINAGFQFKVHDRSALPPDPPPPMGHITESFYLVAQPDICERLGLPQLLDEWGDGVDALLLGALSHHGRPPAVPVGGDGPRSIWNPFAGYDPATTASLLRERARKWFPDAFEAGPPLPDRPALAHLFAGTVALADQIGSDRENHFPFEPVPDSRYVDRARRQARQAIERRRLRRGGWSTLANAPGFRAMFGHDAPRPLQVAVQEAPLDTPLLILESETGSGKTEAALLRFVALLKAGLVDGLYFAVPTRAAAKQLHRRIHAAMLAVLPTTVADSTVLAVPGYCVAGEATGKPVGGFQVLWEDQPDEAERVARWSAESTRHFLSSPVAVGTVDQALLGGLKVKWAHLRGSALARSLLVVDEVHASDAYMTELLTGLLDGHLELGGHALLMSATLGAAARAKFTGRGHRHDVPDLAAATRTPYPSLTLAGAPTSRTERIADAGLSKNVAMQVEGWLGDAARIADAAMHAAQHGAKVLVVRNTVASAQAVLEAVLARHRQNGERLAFAVNNVATLHHGRFAVEDRRLLDEAVEHELGKERAPGGLVVIGTQTLEQSLDIDADLLITDICPADVLLQRIGRLHRHTRDRPAGYADARCIVLAPTESLACGLDGTLMRHGLGSRPTGSGGGIYRDVLGVERTRMLALEHPIWRIPGMNRMLVEAATHPTALRELARQLGGPWLEHEQRTWGIAAAEVQRARGHWLDRSQPFDEDLAFPDLDEAVRTRLGEDGPRFQLVENGIGPFGTPVRTFNLPAHLFGGTGSLPTTDELEAARLEPIVDGGMLHVGARMFRYDRFGIRNP